jgi:hypothetical protein
MNEKCRLDLRDATAEEVLRFHAGWAAARNGEPRAQGQGNWWVRGYIEFLWWNSAPQTWARQ